MYLKSIRLHNYRNYEDLELNLNPGVNIFLGANGQGKTNLMEAVYYLAVGNNFRGNRDLELINWQKNYFRIHGQFKKEKSNRLFDLEVYLDKNKKKQIKINGVKAKSIGDLHGNLQVVLFSPDDLKIIKGSPSERRKYLDTEICQMDKGYYKLIRQYERVLQQRSNLLKDIRYRHFGKEQLEVWNNYLVEYGSKIIFKRIELLKSLVPLARNIQHDLTENKEKFTVTYQSSLGAIGDFSVEEISEVFSHILREKEKEEIERGLNLWGPHRDDLIFYLNGKELKKYGSQGQQRTGILALKMAEIQIFHHKYGEYPLLLLDDVMSELDDKRRAYLIDLVNEKKIQSIITGANIELVTQKILKDEVFQIKEGKIIK
ncbi:MAG: DNA replication/repair protein RecF [Cyanobacteria bacterium SIG29]|nr:DNA replication/repair protein RecF [Cyanobacteria bacterium SIG29]